MVAAPLTTGAGVFLRVGTVCEGELRPAVAPGAAAIVSSYLTSADPTDASVPVIEGSAALPSWVRLVDAGLAPVINGQPISYLAGTPLYRAVAGAPVTQLFSGAQRLPVAARWDHCNRQALQYPRMAQLDRDAGTLSVSPSDASLLQYGYTPGAEVLIRSHQWAWDRVPLTGMTSSQLQLASGSYAFNSAGSLAGWGYQLRNWLPVVTCEGEWMQDGLTNELVVWTTASTAVLRASTASYGLSASLPVGASLAVSRIRVRRSGLAGIRIVGGSQATVSDVQVEQAGEESVRVFGVAAVTIQNSTLRDSTADGVYVSGASVLQIAGNVVTDSGSLGRQGTIATTLNGLRLGNVMTTLIQRNRIERSGFAAVSLGAFPSGASVVVEDNVIVQPCTLLNDCGAVYFNGRATVGGPVAAASALVRGNVVRDGAGNLDGVGGTVVESSVRGVYLDWRMSNVLVQANVFARLAARNGAVFIHGGSGNRIQGNTIFQVESPGVSVGFLTNEGPPYVDMPNNVIDGNVLVSVESDQGALRLIDIPYGVLSDAGVPTAGFNLRAPGLASVSGNTYANLPSRPPIALATDWFDTDRLTFCLQPNACVASATAGVYTAQAAPAARHAQLALNETDATQVVTPVGAPYCDLAGVRVDSVTLAPRTAKVLVACYCNHDGACNNRETAALCPADCPDP